MAQQSLAAVTLVVQDYDEAIAFFCKALRFELLEHTAMGDSKRWVRVAPRGHVHGYSNGAALLLAQATKPEQSAAIGSQTGGRVAFFLHTDSFDDDVAHMQAQGVHFVETPRNEAYGRVVVFEDLCGNRWDLVQPAQ